jgi:hypothetical protein
MDDRYAFGEMDEVGKMSLAVRSSPLAKGL